MYGDEFLQGSHAAEPLYGSFSSSKRQVRILGPIVESAASVLFVGVADDLHRGTVGSKFVGHNDVRFAVPFHRFPEEFQCGLAIAALCNEAFENFPFMINRAPKVVLLPIYFHEHFIQMPLPIRMSTKSLNPFSSDRRGKHRTKTVPPELHRFVADVDATFMQQILGIAK